MDTKVYQHSENSKTIAHNNITAKDFDALRVNGELVGLTADTINRVLVELADWMDCNLIIEDGVVKHITSSSWISNEKPSWKNRIMYHFDRRLILNTKERVEMAKSLADDFWKNKHA